MRYTFQSLKHFSPHRHDVDSVLLLVGTLSFQPDITAEGLSFLQFLAWADTVEQRLTGRLLLLPPMIVYQPSNGSSDELDDRMPYERWRAQQTLMLLEKHFAHMFIWTIDERITKAYTEVWRERIEAQTSLPSLTLLTDISNEEALYEQILKVWTRAM